MVAEKFEYYLPLVKSVKRYGARIRTHTKPLFTGYVFVQLPPEEKRRLYQQELLARAIAVEDEAVFLRQLDEVKRVIASGVELSVHPLVRRGTRVRVIGGPLRGLEGVIDNPTNPQGIVLSVDVLQQGLLVHIPLCDLQTLT